MPGELLGLADSISSIKAQLSLKPKTLALEGWRLALTAVDTGNLCRFLRGLRMGDGASWGLSGQTKRSA
jgi:hypothetical protein